MALTLLVPALEGLGLAENHAFGCGAVFMLLYWGGFFGFLSRRFERQSDLFGARMVDCPGYRDARACTMHRPDEPRGDDLVCPNKAWAFSSALQRIAILNGTALRAGSWRHFGISRRMRFIAEMVGRPDQVRRYDRRLRIFKSLFLGGIVVLGAIVALLMAAGIIQP